MARLVKAGTQVRAVTVFSGYPDSTAAPSDWDARCGFRSAGEAARVRRREDERAWGILGAQPVWWDLDGHESDDEIAEQIGTVLADEPLVLVPGAPLLHPAHERVRRLACARLDHGSLGEFIEQPYEMQASLRGIFSGHRSSRSSDWLAIRVTAAERKCKRRAIAAYASQLPRFAPLLAARIAAWERLVGGEAARPLR